MDKDEDQPHFVPFTINTVEKLQERDVKLHWFKNGDVEVHSASKCSKMFLWYTYVN